MLKPSANGTQDPDLIEALDKLWDALAKNKELIPCSSCGSISFPKYLMEYEKDGEVRYFINCWPNLHRRTHDNPDGTGIEEAGISDAKDLFDVFTLGSLRSSPIAGTDKDPIP